MTLLYLVISRQILFLVLCTSSDTLMSYTLGCIYTFEIAFGLTSSIFKFGIWNLIAIRVRPLDQRIIKVYMEDAMILLFNDTTSN